ncbi:dihydrodipicolinate synthase family protein [Acidobacteriota bacterium]
MGMQLAGIFSPLTTPFIDEELALDHLRENIDRYNAFSLAGYLVLGSTGESIYLTDDESEVVVLAAKEASDPKKKLIVGTARESTRQTIEFTNRIAGIDVDAALVRSPGYFKSRLSREALKSHYLRIADEADIPILIYNIPVHTGYSLSSDLIIELSNHSNIIGIKDSSGNLNQLAEYFPHLREDFTVLLGAASVLLPGLIMGVSGAIITLSDVAPAQCLKLYQLFKDKKWEEARQLQLNLVPLNKALIQTMGVAAVKYSMDLLGFKGGSARSPLPGLNDSEKSKLEEILQKLGLI